MIQGSSHCHGITQEYDIDYEETFVPVINDIYPHSSCACYCCLSADTLSDDVKNTFLNGDLSEVIYMQPPPGITAQPPPWACMQTLTSFLWFKTGASHLVSAFSLISPLCWLYTMHDWLCDVSAPTSQYCASHFICWWHGYYQEWSCCYCISEAASSVWVWNERFRLSTFFFLALRLPTLLLAIFCLNKSTLLIFLIVSF